CHICSCLFLHLSSLTTPPHPISTLFPYTTLFRSDEGPSPRPSPRRRGEGAKAKAPRPACNEGEGEPAPSHSLPRRRGRVRVGALDRKSTRLNSSHVSISYAVFCLKKKKKKIEKEE